MTSSNYYNNNPFLNQEVTDDWADTSQFIYDSPQPDHQTLPIQSGNQPSSVTTTTNPQNSNTSASKQHTQNSTAKSSNPPHLSVPQDPTSQLSSASESSSQTSSSESPANTRHNASSTSSPSALFSGAGVAGTQPIMDTFKTEDDMFVETNETGHYSFEDPSYPSMDTDMDNLSIGNGANLDLLAGSMSGPMSSGMFADTKPEALSSRDFETLKQKQSLNDSPQMTVHPATTQKMFSFGDSRENSPNDFPMNSNSSSPFPLNTGSPLTGNIAQFTTNDAQAAFGGSGINFQPMDPTSASDSMSPQSVPRRNFGAKWPCLLTVDPTPEKSRVETQIPIKLTLHNPPPEIRRIHLPSYTISKPKFQQKPPHEPDDETLELSCMLFCASAMQKDPNIEEAAFKRAEGDEIPIRKEETSSPQQDENDSERPLNGAPVAICSGCIVRERKRAARKKTKKVEEEEEWAKDEAKRVIVFNCPEVRDWCVPNSKEVPVKDHEGMLDAMFVNAPMRIACYCRHQQEKVGFQVIFTLKRRTGEIVAQAISHSIMITDDHKQPIPPVGGAMGFPGVPVSTTGLPQAGQQFGMFPHGYIPQDLPFRPSWSTPDLRLLGEQYAQQQQQQQQAGFSRQFSSSNLANQGSVGSVTPRNLSRPASPTNPAGQPGSKKRRSGGPGHTKVPSGLTMTRLEMTGSNGNMGSAPGSAGFGMGSPTTSSFAGTPLDGNFTQAMRQPNQFQSGTSTPLGPSAFNTDADASSFFSAPTSQHASRASSPTGTRNLPFNSSQAVNSANEAAMTRALSVCPPGLQPHKPPIILRVVPPYGAPGCEVTVLGQNFFQGLEVMFGDVPASSTNWWGDSALLCRAPPMPRGTRVQDPIPIVFRHQHYSSPGYNTLQECPTLMPTRLVAFRYADDGASATATPAVQQTQPGMQMTMSPHNSSSIPGSLANSPTANSPGSGTAGIDDNLAFTGFMRGARYPTGPGSAGFNPASFQRAAAAPQGQAAGGRIKAQRTVSGDGRTR